MQMTYPPHFSAFHTVAEICVRRQRGESPMGTLGEDIFDLSSSSRQTTRHPILSAIPISA